MSTFLHGSMTARSRTGHAAPRPPAPQRRPAVPSIRKAGRGSASLPPQPTQPPHQPFLAGLPPRAEGPGFGLVRAVRLPGAPGDRRRRRHRRRAVVDRRGRPRHRRRPSRPRPCCARSTRPRTPSRSARRSSRSSPSHPRWTRRSSSRPSSSPSRRSAGSPPSRRPPRGGRRAGRRRAQGRRGARRAGRPGTGREWLHQLRPEHVRSRGGQGPRPHGRVVPRVPVREAPDIRGGRPRRPVGPPGRQGVGLHGRPGHR